ncbi:hypothetical protein RSOLAG1IB_11483 [Rhizoctonia solani AG-1 IB]|uniref:Uncharacterized protein n=1 Tax=Thanatephorus cucumeris (strain AG1-IB / isolate 7/3/14) TaxID=1108050 RepID=A0A0B7FBZ3_THACB|nr:hypothetical protein RSOLAG1IB_11483 [Rhizoctonia solani AG-1 IB]
MLDLDFALFLLVFSVCTCVLSKSADSVQLQIIKGYIVWCSGSALDGVGPSLTQFDLNMMDQDLHIFHKRKELLVGTFFSNNNTFSKIPKIHMLQHWTHTIQKLGTPDGYNQGPGTPSH